MYQPVPMVLEPDTVLRLMRDADRATTEIKDAENYLLGLPAILIAYNQALALVLEEEGHEHATLLRTLMRAGIAQCAQYLAATATRPYESGKPVYQQAYKVALDILIRQAEADLEDDDSSDAALYRIALRAIKLQVAAEAPQQEAA